MGQVAAPSESEVDLGVFAKKHGNILEELYEASSQKKRYNFLTSNFRLSSSKSIRSTAHGVRIVTPDISAIPPPTSPPTVVFGDLPILDSPPHPDHKGKGLEEAREDLC
ncbi:hypothetical protein Hanom_Chr17g01587981 [Helianthus anomalus]